MYVVFNFSETSLLHILGTFWMLFGCICKSSGKKDRTHLFVQISYSFDSGA